MKAFWKAWTEKVERTNRNFIIQKIPVSSISKRSNTCVIASVIFVVASFYFVFESIEHTVSRAPLVKQLLPSKRRTSCFFMSLYQFLFLSSGHSFYSRHTSPAKLFVHLQWSSSSMTSCCMSEFEHPSRPLMDQTLWEHSGEIQKPILSLVHVIINRGTSALTELPQPN